MPRVSILTATYDRAALVGRCIDSVLRQDFADWELVIVDDGSTDDTPAVLARYADPRIRVLVHERNRGVTAAKNTALGAIRGEWFTFLDSDDELVPHALSTLLAVPDRVDPAVDALSCNCVDSVTGAWTGTGLDRDQPVSFAVVLGQMRGEHWGLTKTALLEGRRFNERIAGAEGIVWFPINARARRYYVHQALRIYHTEGTDRVSTTAPSAAIARRREHYLALEDEREYLALLKRWRPDEYGVLQSNIAMMHVIDGRRARALDAYREIPRATDWKRRAATAATVVLGPWFARGLLRYGLRAR